MQMMNEMMMMNEHYHQLVVAVGYLNMIGDV
jgi:hypothetical protein